MHDGAGGGEGGVNARARARAPPLIVIFAREAVDAGAAVTTRVAPRGMESFAHAFPLPTAMLDPVVGANSTRVVIIVGGVLRVDSARSAARPSPTELSPALHASQPAPLLKEISVKSKVLIKYLRFRQTTASLPGAPSTTHA